MPSPEKIKVRDFHVVGGGCFGSQYTRWLLRAQKLGWLNFENIWIIDQDSHCQAAQTGLLTGPVQLREVDWVAYFSHYLQKHHGDPGASEDHWVPSPLSPHILFLGFLQAAGEEFEIQEFREEVPPPVRIPLPVGSLAVSFAQWKCPVNCIEPPTCPAIHEERHWDMKRSLKDYFAGQEAYRSAHVLQCQHLIHGVGTIPCREIFQAYRIFLDDLAGQKKNQMVLATVSGCHGLIGKAQRVL
ncbi:MAG: hypothetical protein R3257_01680 [bacterium]|nr:hypothetical protein [bacterium]